MRALMGFGVAAAMAFSAGIAEAQDNRPAMAIFPFENGGSYGEDAEVFDALRVGMQQMLMTEMAQNSGVRLVDRAQLNTLLEEQDLGASGRVDERTAARIGKITGAKYAVFGSFIDFYGDFRIDVRIVSVETSELVNVARVRDQREKLYQLLVDLAANVMEDVNLPPLPSEVSDSRQAREIPTEAMTLYSRGIFYRDRGMTERAIALFERVASEFPQMTEATEQLRQIRS
jgi:TolB-like protein